MTKLNAEQIAQHAHDAGFRGQGLTTAVAVALAESGGDTRSHNGTPPDNSYGLWQINMLGGMGPERRAQYHLDSNNDLFHADTNAKVAYSLSDHGKSWSPWSTYTNGAYRKYLDRARKAAHEVSGKHHKPGHHKPGHGGGGGASGGGHGGRKEGFAVDTDQLSVFTRQAKERANALDSIGDRNLHAVQSIAEDSFGRIGRETGFAAALNSFSAALKRQVKTTGTNAEALGTAANKVSRTYREQEKSVGKDLGNLFG